VGDLHGHLHRIVGVVDMSPSYTVNEAAEELGITANGVRYRLKTGVIKGRRTNKGWRVYLNGDEVEQPPEPEISDELMEIGDELIAIGKRLKRAIKEHDAEVRRETIVDFAASIAEAAERGR
jgi:predicted transcriptional regulator